MKTFDDILKLLPPGLLYEIEQLKSYNEDNIHHPEPSVYEHIKIVTERLMLTGDINLILSGLLHDIGKLKALNITMEKTGEYRCFGHDKISAEMVCEYKDFIVSLNGNYDIIYYIVLNHMRIKEYDNMSNKKKKQLSDNILFDKLLLFAKADNMLNEFKI